MVDEILYMQIRILTQYSIKYNIDPQKCNEIFEKCGIYDYISDVYDLFHMTGDDYIINDIHNVIEKNGELVKCC